MEEGKKNNSFKASHCVMYFPHKVSILNLKAYTYFEDESWNFSLVK